MESCSSVMKLCRSALTVPLLLIIITGSVLAHPVVKVEFNGTAVLNCTVRCTGIVSWNNSTDLLAECDQTSCRSLKEGYQMIYNQFLQGDFSLIITEADFSKRGNYTCKCDGRNKCDVELQIEARRTSVQIQSGGSLHLELEVSDPVQVNYNSSTGAADGSSVQICKVIGGSLQSEPEYKHRTSLLSVLELRGVDESDSGLYTIRNTNNHYNLHIYNVTVTAPGSGGASDLLWILIIPAVLILVLFVWIVWQMIKIEQLKVELERVLLNQLVKCTVQNSDWKKNSPEDWKPSAL
ncbi:uncharacterized protein LOC125786867 [Astyanax mexicanus]|uniref:uncharacterized protein LOC125786867 n=1 Tax=Astyanax mexicanus TaxID=7994 RepID=UPI0020CB4BAA|nr:uncharacterized protein LOC125786867 [Astyanax mexicanus]